VAVVRTTRAGSAPKRAAIERAALDAFVSDGFARTSVDRVAADAGVSKRTVYDYFGDKEQLFLSVLDRALHAHQEEFSALLERTLGGEITTPADLESALVGFGVEFATGTSQSRQRTAMIQLITTEAAHFPQLLELWRSRNPQQTALAQRLREFARSGLLDLDDAGADEAAAHLGILTTTLANERTLYGTAAPIEQDVLRGIVARGVHVFLHGSGAR
jgi:TetR/AcrR family transcriptional regulator, mexJK operon transcriptional repressor